MFCWYGKNNAGEIVFLGEYDFTINLELQFDHIARHAETKHINKENIWIQKIQK